MTNDERLTHLRNWASTNELVRYLCDHYRLRGLHPYDVLAFEGDVREIIDIALERGLCAGREAAQCELLVASPLPGLVQ